MSEDTGKPEGDPKEPEEKKQEEQKVQAEADSKAPLQGPKETECPLVEAMKKRRKRVMLCSCKADPLDFLELQLRRSDKL